MPLSALAAVVAPAGGERRNALEAMLRTAEGAFDAEGTWRGDAAGLAQRARFVTPEEGPDAAPLRDEQRDLTLVADVRLDNRDELIRALRDTSGVGLSSSDGDLLLAAYAAWGDRCLPRLVGAFAFALWDGRRRRLLAARDPLGKRPLHYVERPNRLALASTAAQLLALPDVSAEPDPMAMAAYLVAAPPRLDCSFYRDVRALPPAHALAVEPGRPARTWRYWDIDPDFRIDYADERDYEAHFQDLFRQAVRARLRSRAPVGILLSGGLDSGSVASTAGWLRERGEVDAAEPLHTFSFARADGAPPDERNVSDHIVRRYGLVAHDVWADAAWPLKDYPAHGPHRDSPLIGAYQVLLDHAAAAAAAQGLRTLLTGHRGDLVAGEGIYDFPGLLGAGHWGAALYDLRLLRDGRGWPLRRALVHAFAAPLRRAVWPPGTAEHLRLRRRQAMRRRRGATLHPRWVPQEWHERVEADRSLAVVVCPPDGLSYARQQRYLSVFSPFHMHTAEWQWRTYTRFGLDHADPWSDRRLVEFALAVPQWALNRPGRHKGLVRRAMAGIVPEPARLGARKVSPEPFLDEALRLQERRTVEALITAPAVVAYGLTDEAALRKAYDAYLRGAAEPLLWYTLTLEMWLRRFHLR
jgi:asparagine synthase (glutamine-hydrolysing)